MPIQIVYLNVKPECVDAFQKLCLYNCENSRREPGNVRFDLLRDTGDPNKFVLFEHFRDQDAVEFHKTTEHYKKWAAEVSDYLSVPRSKTGYEPVNE